MSESAFTPEGSLGSEGSQCAGAAAAPVITANSRAQRSARLTAAALAERYQQSRRANWFLLALSVVATLAAIELTLRIRQLLVSNPSVGDREHNRVLDDATIRLHRPSSDPVLRYEPRPGAVVERDGTVYRINAQGLRDDRDVGEKQPGERRVLLLGDSVAFGFGVDREATFASLVEDQLAARGLPTRVLNQSVLGYRTTQEVRRFQSQGMALKPDGVILAFCLNDFDDYSGELTLLDPSARLGPGGYYRIPPRRIAGIELPDPTAILDRSLLFQKITDRLFRLDYYRWIGKDSKNRQEVAESIATLGDELRRNHIPGLVAIFPLLVDTHPYPYTDIHRFVAAVAAGAGFDVVDLGDTFSKQSPETLRGEAKDVLHLNKRGHAESARILAPCLAAPALRCPQIAAATP